jgi:carboxypeptidase family protein/TonB-dependent receptor-like protein
MAGTSGVRSLRCLLVFMACLAASVVPARGQVTGVFSGVIIDAQSGVLPGVALTLINTETGAMRTLATDASGTYRFAGLQPGRYELRAELSGFAPVEITNLVLNVGAELRRDITMSLSNVVETVTVSGQAAVVETTKSEVSAVVTQQQIEALPVGDRQAVSLSLLLPGTGADTTRPRRNNANIGAGGIAIFSSNFMVDGTSNMSSKAGEPRQDYPQAAVREFRVNVSQTPAQFGGRTGGVVTIATKSGTNLFSGDVVEFFRDKSLNAMNVFEQQDHDQKGAPKPAYRRNQFGASFGGPVVKDKLHFFVAAERTVEDQRAIVNTGAPQYYSALEGSIPIGTRNNLVFARGDAQLTSQQNVFLRYGWQDSWTLCEGCGGTNAAFTGDDLWLPRDSWVAGHTWVISPRLLNEFRAQKAIQWHYQGVPGHDDWREVGAFPRDRTQWQTPLYTFPSLIWGVNTDLIVFLGFYEARDDMSVTFNAKGSHSVKFGGAFSDLPLREDVPGAPLGAWQFSTDQPFDGTPATINNLRNPTQFTASFPPLTRSMENRYYEAYVQDEWRPGTNLTLNLGLRYDVQHGPYNEGLRQSDFPRPLPYVDFASRGDGNNIQPRLGFAWDVANNGKSVVRGGYGLVYHAIVMTWTVAEITTLKQTSITIRNPTYPDPYGGKSPEAFAPTTPPNIQILSNDLKQPSAHTVNLGFSHELAANFAVNLDAVYTKTLDFPVAVNVNSPDPLTKLRTLPEWGRIVMVSPVGEAKYKAMFVRLEKRLSHNYQYLVSYTLAKADTNFPGVAQTPARTDYFTPDSDFGPAASDRRHTIVVSGSVLLPFNINLGAVWTLRSTMPFSALAGTDLNGDGAVTDYVPGTTNDQGNRGNANFLALVNTYRATRGLAAIPESQIDSNRYNRMDVRVGKAFPVGGNRKVELIGQVFNLLGTNNPLASGGAGTWVTNAGSASFGRILQALPSRQAEVAIRMAW